jgi:hypothetical protein
MEDAHLVRSTPTRLTSVRCTPNRALMNPRTCTRARSPSPAAIQMFFSERLVGPIAIAALLSEPKDGRGRGGERPDMRDPMFDARGPAFWLIRSRIKVGRHSPWTNKRRDTTPPSNIGQAASRDPR